MRRVLVPEILDDLAADDPRAVRSRADLRRINWLMGQALIMAGLVRRHVEGERLSFLELGAGDAMPALRLARRLKGKHSLTLLDMVDTAPPERIAEIGALGWNVEVVTADAFAWLAATDQCFDVVLANLFLHHFEGERLVRLLALVAARTTTFLATEPRRDRPSWLAATMTIAIGANDVTRHDAPASVRAGFTGDELGVLWRAANGTVLEERRRGPFTHAFAGRGVGGA